MHCVINYILCSCQYWKIIEGLHGAWSKYGTPSTMDSLEKFGFHLEICFKARFEQSKLAIKLMCNRAVVHFTKPIIRTAAEITQRQSRLLIQGLPNVIFLHVRSYGEMLWKSLMSCLWHASEHPHRLEIFIYMNKTKSFRITLLVQIFILDF